MNNLNYIYKRLLNLLKKEERNHNMKYLKVAVMYLILLVCILWYCNFPSNTVDMLISTAYLSLNIIFPIIFAFIINWMEKSSALNIALNGKLKYIIYIYVILFFKTSIINTYYLITTQNIKYMEMYLPTILMFYSCQYFCDKIEKDSQKI